MVRDTRPDKSDQLGTNADRTSGSSSCCRPDADYRTKPMMSLRLYLVVSTLRFGAVSQKEATLNNYRLTPVGSWSRRY
jgi:hypothetical protein